MPYKDYDNERWFRTTSGPMGYMTLGDKNKIYNRYDGGGYCCDNSSGRLMHIAMGIACGEFNMNTVPIRKSIDCISSSLFYKESHITDAKVISGAKLIRLQKPFTSASHNEYYRAVMSIHGEDDGYPPGSLIDELLDISEKINRYTEKCFLIENEPRTVLRDFFIEIGGYYLENVNDDEVYAEWNDKEV